MPLVVKARRQFAAIAASTVIMTGGLAAAVAGGHAGDVQLLPRPGASSPMAYPSNRSSASPETGLTAATALGAVDGRSNAA